MPRILLVADSMVCTGYRMFQLVCPNAKERGWDIKTGLMPREKLEDLGLKGVADDLQRTGKLPAWCFAGLLMG